MAGLLDMLGGYQDETAPASGGLDDPKIQGLLTAGLAMLGSRGNFAQALSEGGLAGVQSMQQGQAFGQQSAMRDMQLQQQRDAIEAQKRRQAWIQSLPDPQGAPDQPVDPMAQVLLGGVKAGVFEPSAYLQSMQKDNTPMAVPEGTTLLDKRTMKPIFSNPKNETPTEVREYQHAQAQGYSGTFMQYQLDKRKAAAANTNVNVSMDKGFGETFAKDAAQMLGASRDKARASAATLQTLDRIDAAVRDGAITGPAADARTLLTRIGSMAGVAGKSADETLARTQDLLQGQAQLAINGAQLMAGQGQITDRERELINRAAGGGLSDMSAPEIRQLTGVLRKVNQQQIASHQNMLRNVGPQFQSFVPFYDVQMPPPAPMPRPAPGPVPQPAGGGAIDFNNLPPGR